MRMVSQRRMRLEDGAGGLGVRRAVGVAVVNDLVHVAAGQLLGRVAEGARGGLIDEGERPSRSMP